MNSTKCAAAVGAGYLLGRWHKARWALALAGMVAGKKISTNPKAVLEQLMEASPQLQDLADNVRGELADAGKKAAVAAAGNRLGGITERLRERTDALRNGAESHSDEAEEDEPDEDEPDEEERKDSGATKEDEQQEKRQRQD